MLGEFIAAKLAEAFKATARAHNKFQEEQLGGKHHRLWLDWYAQYLFDNFKDLFHGITVEKITALLKSSNRNYNNSDKKEGWIPYYTKSFIHKALEEGELVSMEPWAAAA